MLFNMKRFSMIDAAYFKGLLTSICITCRFSGEVKVAEATVNCPMTVTRTRKLHSNSKVKVDNVDFIWKCLGRAWSLHPV